jgi:methylated-DNA-[protein]-cysteine S-methyltransferase
MDYQRLETPIGPLLVAGDATGLRRIELPRDGEAVEPGKGWMHRPGRLRAALRQLEDYFAGRRRSFDLELRPEGTEFQREVWSALRRIPYGTTISYGELACRVGRPRASRAVGAANGRNPLPIVIPCHRVIGSDGRLTGFGGGLPAKRWLLAHEDRA